MRRGLVAAGVWRGPVAAGVRRGLLAAVAAVAAVAGCGGGTSAAGGCPDVEVVFARGTNEKPGLGRTGAPLVLGLREALPDLDVDAYAVDYEAVFDQSSAGPGATEMTRHVRGVARRCAKTRFVLGGYSQGASVTDIAIGMTPQLGRGKVIPRRLARRVSAVVVFGNPARRFGQRIDRDGGRYAAKALDDCNAGDPVCANGDDFTTHLAYKTDGSVPAAVRFLRRRLR